MEAQITIRLPAELNEQIAKMSQQLGLKRSDVVRMALRRFVDEHAEDTVTRPYDRVRDLIGSVESGIPDLGTDHRKHLLEKLSRRDA